MNKKAVFIFGVAKGAKLKHTMKAISIAYTMHKGQKRKDGVTDYVEHVVGAAHLLLAHGIIDDVILAVAILHDLIEDTSFAYEDIEREFNKEIADLVWRLTKKDGSTEEKYYKNIEEDIRALLGKAADRTHNVSDMVKVFSAEKMESYIIETEKYILPAMKRARKISLEYGDVFVALGEHIKAVLLLAKEVVKLRGVLKEEK
jgi:(p)ppGpp synthase/HD superfamily hydrolase